MKVKQFFENHPVFRYEEFASFMISKGTTRQQSWRQQLGYHVKEGHLIHIRKYLYAVKPMITQEHWVDPYLLCSKITPDAILAYHTALELHGAAYTTFSELTFITARQIKPFVYEAQRYRAARSPKTLIIDGNEKFGLEEIKRGGSVIKLTNPERTIVDILDRPELGGGWEEIWKSFDNITTLNIDKVVEYALLLKNATTIAKVGFFLEQRPDYLAINKACIEELLPHIPKQPHYMNRSQRSGAEYIEKWRLLVSKSIINRTWEEPDVENI